MKSCRHRKGTPPVAEFAHFFFFFNTYISTFLVQLEPAAHPHGFHQLCLKYQVLTDSSWWGGAWMWEGWWYREVGVWGRGGLLLLCGQDRFTRGHTDGRLRCENSLSRQTPGIPGPPKGGRLGDLGGTHSSLYQRSKSRGWGGWSVLWVVVGVSEGIWGTNFKRL